MLKEQKIQQLQAETQKLRQFLIEHQTPPAGFLQKLCDLVEAVSLDARQVSAECDEYKESHENLMIGLASLTALRSFRAQETVPEQWAIEHKGIVVASGSSLIEAARSLNQQRPTGDDLASVVSADL